MANSKLETVSLEWTYSPKDYFEEPIKIENDQYVLEINSGDVRITMDSVVFNQDSNIHKRLERKVLAHFLGCQVTSCKIFNFSGSRVIRNHSNENGAIFLKIEDEVKIQDSADVITQDTHGKTIGDTKSDRMREQREFAGLSAKYSEDDALEAMLLSNHASVNDPDNAFIHLYEIREILSKKFSGEKNVKEKLRISPTDWSFLGKLSNKEPIRQGRHRGTNFGSLRDVTEEELKEARRIVKDLIKNYIDYFEGESSVS